MNPLVDPTEVRALLLDIEGTTTSVSFVYHTLFPYAREHLRSFLQEHYDDAGFRSDLVRLRQEHALDAGQPGCPAWSDASRESEAASALAYLNWLMDRDRKSTALKSIQGKIWEAGYANGKLRGHVYPDVLPAFQRWRSMGKRIAIFSSGSVLAQKLLFSHTTEGDLTPHLEAYFDTTTGAKTEPASYQRIAQALRLPPGQVLFVSDSAAELDAAEAAGMIAALCVRPESGRPESSRQFISSFDEILPRRKSPASAP